MYASSAFDLHHSPAIRLFMVRCHLQRMRLLRSGGYSLSTEVETRRLFRDAEMMVLRLKTAA